MKNGTCGGTWGEREAGTFKKLKNVPVSFWLLDIKVGAGIGFGGNMSNSPPWKSPPLPLESTYESSSTPGTCLRAPVSTFPQTTLLESGQGSPAQEDTHLVTINSQTKQVRTGRTFRSFSKTVRGHVPVPCRILSKPHSPSFRPTAYVPPSALACGHDRTAHLLTLYFY